MVSAARTEVRLSETPGSNVLLSTTDVAAAPAVASTMCCARCPDSRCFAAPTAARRIASVRRASRCAAWAEAPPAARWFWPMAFLSIDPFGGWVYWDRVPRTAISTVEVVRGGASNLYGSDAMAGVVQLLMRQPEAPAFSLETSYGNERTPDLSLWTGSRVGKWDYSATTEMFRTDGFFARAGPHLRGPSIQAANVEDATVYARIGHELGANGQILRARKLLHRISPQRHR